MGLALSRGGKEAEVSYLVRRYSQKDASDCLRVFALRQC